MTSRTAGLRQPLRNPNVIVFLMLLAVFGVGTIEYLTAGLLLPLSRDFAITPDTGGLLITVYALTVVIGGPLLTILTSRIRRVHLIIALMVLFVAGNVLTIAAPNFGVLVLARVLTALPHATFFALCLVLATTIASPGQQGRVISRITLGLNLATVLGIPLGSLVGNEYGWRAPFLIIAISQSIITGALVVAIRNLPETPHAAVSQEIRIFSHREVVKALCITMLSQAGLFVLFTYIAPYLSTHVGFTPESVTILLLVFGTGSIVGNILGGYLADRNLSAALYISLSSLAAALFVLAAFGNHQWFTIIWLFVVGAAGFSIIPPLTSTLIGAAHEAPHLAVTVNIAGFQLANAAGAWVGSTALRYGLDVGVLPAVGAALTASAGVLLYTLNRRATSKVSGERLES